MNDELKIEFKILFGLVAVVIIICLVKGMTTEVPTHVSTTNSGQTDIDGNRLVANTESRNSSDKLS